MEAGDEENRHESVEDELVSERPRLSEDERLAEKVLRHRGVRGDSFHRVLCQTGGERIAMDEVERERRADGGQVRGQQPEPTPDPELAHRAAPFERRGDDEPAAQEEDEHAALADPERLGREAKCLGPQSLGEVGDHDHHRGDSTQSIEELEATVAGRRVGRRDGTLCGDRHPDSVGGPRNLDR